MKVARAYQTNSIDDLRKGIAEGHNRQVLCASTGAGKSIMAIMLIRNALEKGSRVMFLCDRRVLVGQFSQHLHQEEIPHGIIMAGHSKRMYEKVQIASVQTLEKMDGWPQVDLLIVDEIHAVMRGSLKAMLDAMPKMRVIGLTATPFHAELPKYFSRVTNVITMSDLVEQGFLVPFRVFAATEIDTKGVKVTAGEWQKDQLEERGLQIVGDVVADYVKIYQQVWGEPKKTICFSAGVSHGAELVKRFAEQGLNFVQISYLDSEEYKAEVLKEFAKPNTEILGVISTDILTRGFDQPDVEHVIIAKPLRKSFSQHVQMVGRGARICEGKQFCIAEGQRVITDHGLIAIEKVCLYHKLWDGESFVSHGGVIYKGEKDVIEYCGLTATKDHKVKTREGWRSFGECASKQIPIVQTGFGGHAIRESENMFSACGVEREKVEDANVCSLRVSDMLEKVFNKLQQFIKGYCRGMLKVQPTKNNTEQRGSQTNISATTKMHKSEECTIYGLWRERNRVQIQNCFGWLFMGNGKPRNTGMPKELSVRQNRQQRALRSREFAMGYAINEFVSYKAAHVKCKASQFQAYLSANTLCGPNIKAFIQYRVDRRKNNREVPQTIIQTKRKVWDILNSGPRNCFTCEGLLVHNCVIQDNSGNWLRFNDSFSELYEDGVKTLESDADQKTRKEPTDKEKKQSCCPQCKTIWPNIKTDTCPTCGFLRERRNKAEAVAGEISELTLGKKKKEPVTMEYKKHFYHQLLQYARGHGYQDGWAYHKYKNKFGVYPNCEKAVMPVGIEVYNWVMHENIKNAKRRRA